MAAAGRRPWTATRGTTATHRHTVTARTAEAASGGGRQWQSDELVRAQVRNYISRAIELGDESGLIRQVVDFVFLRQFDVGREEQWRTEMTRQIHNVEMELKSQMETLRGDVVSALKASQGLAGSGSGGGEGGGAKSSQPSTTTAPHVAHAAPKREGSAASSSVQKEMASGSVLAKLDQALPTLLDHATRAHAISSRVQAKVDDRVGGVEARMATQAAALDVRLKGIEEAMAAFGAKLQVPEETYRRARRRLWRSDCRGARARRRCRRHRLASRDGRENLSFDL